MITIKIGGSVVENLHPSTITDIKKVAEREGVILVHGGGKLATKLADDLKVSQQMVEGRRITDAETLKIVTMVYAGYINKNIVASLQALGVNAIGLTGADGNLIQSHKRVHASIDFGFVGDVDQVNSNFIDDLLNRSYQATVADCSYFMNLFQKQAEPQIVKAQEALAAIKKAEEEKKDG